MTPIFEAGRLQALAVQDRNGQRSLRTGAPWSLQMSDGSHVSAAQVSARPVGAIADPHRMLAAGGTGTSGPALRCYASQLEERHLEVTWCLVADPDQPYARELLQLRATDADVALREVSMLEMQDADARVVGTVQGSPVVDRTMFFGFEHPLSSASAAGGAVRLALARTLPLRAGQQITYSAVLGTAPAGQMRRRFLAYLERERPRPYSPFLHGNSWYDIGYRNRFSEADVLDRISAFGQQLTERRGVKLDSFLLDDGWDDTHSLWQFNAGFPNGLKASAALAARYGFHLGLWFSPWGGYNQQKVERIAFGRQHGYEILNDGFALSGPRYYQQFEQICQQMVSRFGVNQFKFDGTGNADRVVAGSAFDSDFSAAIHLIEGLRREQPRLFINLTTGTYASPFWLFYADSIWHGGEDHDFSGVGTARQRWITYRDAQTYKNVVQKGPLFPLNSLMLHGVIYAKSADGLDTDPGQDFADEVHSFFGTGTQTQELYLTPELLSAKNWDTVAEAARWSRSHENTLADVHWVGGDPDQLQPYGWAAWSRTGGIITLRNPGKTAQTFPLRATELFELMPGEAQHFRLHRVWGAAGTEKLEGVDWRAGTSIPAVLAPFEVLTLEASPLP